MMTERTVTNFFLQLGLTEEEAKIYLALTQKGPLTVLELARTTNINRTKVYRLLEKLKKIGIIEEVVEEYRRLAKAADLHQLDFLLREQETKVNFLRQIFPSVSTFLSNRLASSQPGTKVLFYRGTQAIKQMAWNTLRAKDECVGYSYRTLREIVGEKFDKKWREEWKARKLKFRDLYSDEYLVSMKKEERIEHSLYFQSRYLPRKVLNIDHQIDIYNDVISFYNWHKGEIFGVEIYNEKVARLQKQIFEILWKVAKKPNTPKIKKFISLS